VIGGNPLYVFGPKGIPEVALRAVHDAFKKGIETDQFKNFAEQKSLSVDYKGPEELAHELERDAARYEQIVKKLGLGGK
jgi:tripartite-type tricarboxylate transporter receptor subunit TctC